MILPVSIAAALFASAQAAAAPTREIEIRSAFATALSGLNSFISNDDYPAEARRDHDQGIVRFHIVIGATGRVSDCAITGTSGHASLDAATCALARDRFRFVPGRDEYGLPTTDQGDYVMTWRLLG